MARRREPSNRRRVTAKHVQTHEADPIRVPVVPIKPEVDDEPWGEDGLNTRQRAFVDALLGPAAGVATKAAEIAGYRADNREALRVTACRLLTYANVQKRIARAYADRIKNDPEWAGASLIEVANSSMANFVELGPDGECTVNMAKAAEAGALGQIREYREEVLSAGEGTNAKVIKRTVKIHDRVPALRTLLQLTGKLIERHDVLSGGKPLLEDAELRKRILGDREALELGNALARRLALNAGGDGESSN